MNSVRMCTINFWGLQPPLERRIALAIRQLDVLRPDIVAIQEVRPLNGVDGETTADRLADALGYGCVYEPALRWKADAFHAGFPAGEEGLAVLSNLPIVERRATALPEARPTEARILLSTRVNTDAGAFWFHTTHLHWRLADGCARERQVVAIDEIIQRIETPLPQVLCGDFNATPDSDEIRFLRGLCTLAGRRTYYQDAWLRVHPQQPGLTWCALNPNTREMRSVDIDRRIDYVFVTTRCKDGRGTVLGAQVVLNEKDSDGLCISDHYGVVADVQIAPTAAT